MATRHHARAAVVSLLYAFDMGNIEISKHIDDMLEEKKIRNKQRDFAISLFNGVIEHLSLLDEKISKELKEWDFDRLGSIERAVLRLGAYEILHNKIDTPVIINEAIELTKELGSEQSPKFINGVLDAVGRAKDS